MVLSSGSGDSMAELVKKLHVKKSGTDQTAKAYSTTAEAGPEYIENKIDGITCYVPVGDTLDSRATKGEIAKTGTTTTKAILSTGKPLYTKLTYTTPGTYTITWPAGVTTARVTVAAAGGGGGGGNHMSHGPYLYGGNGGRGGLVTQNIAVISGVTVQVIVGAGGAGGVGVKYSSNQTSGASGGNSAVGSISARGGGGGYRATTPYSGSEGWEGGSDGADGASYGAGGIGGSRTGWSGTAGSGANGWVYIEYGGDI